MSRPIFDSNLRTLRRDRAQRNGVAMFLYERTFADILERLSDVHRSFSSALLIGCPDSAWPERLALHAGNVTVVDPGPRFATAAAGKQLIEDEERLGDADHDLCVAVGTLETVNDLPLALANIRAALTPDALFIGAMSGGETLPVLRHAMRAADATGETASPRIHPRIAAPSLGALLARVGFTDPVVDIDRVSVSYPSLSGLVGDLRAMAATNILAERSKIPLGRTAWASAMNQFEADGKGGRTVETFEILHFSAWTPTERARPRSAMNEGLLT